MEDLEELNQYKKEYQLIVQKGIDDYNNFVESLQKKYFNKSINGIVVEYSPKSIAYIENIDKDEINFTQFEYCLEQNSSNVFTKYNRVFKTKTTIEFTNICSIEQVYIDCNKSIKELKNYANTFLTPILIESKFNISLINHEIQHFIYVNPLDMQKLLIPIYISDIPREYEFLQSKGLENKNGYWTKAATS